MFFFKLILAVVLMSAVSFSAAVNYFQTNGVTSTAGVNVAMMMMMKMKSAPFTRCLLAMACRDQSVLLR